MSWLEHNLGNIAFCLVNSSYGSRDAHAKAIRKYLTQAYDAGRKAERQAQEDKRRPCAAKNP